MKNLPQRACGAPKEALVHAFRLPPAVCVIYKKADAVAKQREMVEETW